MVHDRDEIKRFEAMFLEESVVPVRG